jgi:hypothetical protein
VILALVSFHCAKLISVKFRRVTASLRFRFVQTEILAGTLAMSYVWDESLTRSSGHPLNLVCSFVQTAVQDPATILENRMDTTWPNQNA